MVAAFFALAETFAVPVVVISLAVMPYRGGPPLAVSTPAIFWTLLGVAILIPGLTALFIYAKLRRTLDRALRSRRDEAESR
jgi:uncharacterized membrane protein